MKPLNKRKYDIAEESYYQRMIRGLHNYLIVNNRKITKDKQLNLKNYDKLKE